MSQKTIQFNPSFLSMAGSKSSANKTLKRGRKEKPVITMNPNKVKKQLIDKIKTFQLKEKENDILEKTKDEQEKINIEKDFNNDFNNSVKFLEELSKKEREKHNNKLNRKKNNTLKAGKIENEIKMQIETELPPEMKIPFKSSFNQKVVYSPNPPVPTSYVSAPLVINQPISAETVSAPLVIATPVIKPQVSAQTVSASPVIATPVSASLVIKPQVMAQPPPPQYSNLKNSVLPTFRQWKNNTQKNYEPHQEKPSIKIDDYEINNEKTERAIALENIKKDYKNNNTNIIGDDKENVYNKEIIQLTFEEPSIINKQIPKKRRHRITKTHKYTLGRKGDKVSVLIKNAKTRKLVQHELALLKQKGIPEIKTFLRKKNLLKVGSDAPNDVLRQIYEQSILSGDVENKAKDVLIHNYMNH
jgi:hypothetical protein